MSSVVAHYVYQFASDLIGELAKLRVREALQVSGALYFV
jgi:hypothetical protein